jgi:hypothetical protein
LLSVVDRSVGHAGAFEADLAPSPIRLQGHSGEVFAPTLRPAQIVVMDNLCVHQGARVQELVEERGCKPMYLLAYSPVLRLVFLERGRPTAAAQRDRIGDWLSLSVGQALDGGIGARGAVYRAGGLGDPSALIGNREIAATDGYTAGVPDDAHFGLGTNTEIDVRVTLPPGSRGLATNGVIEVRNVPADRYLRLPDGCGGAYSDGQKH